MSSEKEEVAFQEARNAVGQLALVAAAIGGGLAFLGKGDLVALYGSLVMYGMSLGLFRAWRWGAQRKLFGASLEALPYVGLVILAPLGLLVAARFAGMK